MAGLTTLVVLLAVGTGLVFKESVAFTKNGTVYLIDGHGYLRVGHGDFKNPSSLTLTPGQAAYLGPGRPLGFHVDEEGNLLTCNSILGLTRLPPGSHSQQILSNAVHNSHDPGFSPILYADDLDVAANGDIYFSDASAIPSAITRSGRYDAMRSYMLTALQGAATGRLLRWVKATGETEVLDDGFWFPNGVALAADESAVVFAETTTARILKHHLVGPKASFTEGTTEILINSLPGYPDGVSRAPDGHFWAALVTDHVPLLDWAARSRLARWALAWFTHFVQLPLVHKGAVLKAREGFSLEGEVLQLLVDPDATVVGAITSAVEHEGHLYMGSLANHFTGVLDLSLV